jgi:predicted MFS family arabinose efflux permease
MPFFFAAFNRRWARHRRTTALLGVVITGISFVLSSYSTSIWQVIITQGILAAFGSVLIYSPTTLTLGEAFTTSNRAVAYAVVLSCKNIVGSICPFLFQHLLDRYGFRMALRIWACIVIGTGLGAVFLLPFHAATISTEPNRSRKTPWHFLKHQTFYIYSIATMLQSSGYGIPQTYINTYAYETASLSQTSATLLLTLFNIPGIFSSSFFGFLTDNKRYPLSATTVTCLSSLTSALAVFFLWGLGSRSSMTVLSLFTIIFGCFSSAYSATWGGVLKQMEREAAERNEAVDTGVVYGLLNGARGIGFVGGGLAGVQLLKVGSATSIGSGDSGYGTEYGPLILFTGLSSIFGGWSVLWRCKQLFR